MKMNVERRRLKKVRVHLCDKLFNLYDVIIISRVHLSDKLFNLYDVIIISLRAGINIVS